ncbi:MAG: BACON domain-containing carbohydrate-binding protein [Chitinophagaceae bacterium]
MVNTFTRQAFVFLSLTLFILSCRKHETITNGTLTLSTNAIHVDTTVNTQATFTVQSTVPWIAQLPTTVNWISIDKTSGAPGNTIIKLTVLSNNGTATPQTATITFSPGINSNIPSVSITVTQKPVSLTFGFRRALGGQKEDQLSSQTINTPDGGIVLAGTTSSNDGDVHKNHGLRDAWIVKLNAGGDTVWTKTYGGTLDDNATSIVAATDGGYIVAGSTKSTDGDIHANHGDADLWVLKLNANGDTLWTKTYGGSATEGNGFIVTAPDGGYVISGFTASNNGDVQGNHGGEDMWLIKIDRNGALLWSHVYGGSNLDEVRAITATPDGGFVLAGLTDSNDQDVTGFHIPVFIGFDMWVVKVDGNGNKLWAHALGGTFDDVAIAVTSSASGYVVTGYTTSNNGDVPDYHGPATPFYHDMLAIKLDNDGNKLWAHAFGGSREEYGLAVASTSDGGYILAGGTSSIDGDVAPGYHGNGGTLDMWILKIDKDGNKQWNKTIGSTGDDYPFSVVPVPEGFIIAGVSEGNDLDMAGAASHGDLDIWITKLLVQ